MTGGGSGGHITPILAVARELKKLQPQARVIYIGQRGDALSDVPQKDSNIDEAYFISAGKLRRYHGEGIQQVLHLPTTAKNVRDAFRTVRGFGQSYWLLKRLRPDVIFVKGGFVGVPVGLAAATLGIPFVTHDSDALPGLANRLIARWAAVHAVALPKEVYQYPPSKTVTVGVPISHQYQMVNAKQQAAFRNELGLAPEGRMLFVTGGGNGAQRLNSAVVACGAHLLQRYADLTIVHVAGRALEADVRRAYQQELGKQTAQQRVHVHGFVHELYRYSGAADVVITRAGATTMAEFAAQGRACVVVPNPQLTGGHQLKNAQALVDRRAVKLVGEDKLARDPLALMPVLTDLFDHPKKQQELGANLHKLAKLDATKRLAVLLLDQELLRKNAPKTN